MFATMMQRTSLLTVPLFLGAGIALAGMACGSSGGAGTAGTGGSATTGPSSSSSGASASGNGGGTSASSSSSTSTSSTSSTSASSTSTTSSGSTCLTAMPLGGACAPGAACMAGTSTCLAHIDQSTSTTPGFRMAQIAFAKPATFSQGVVANVLQGGVQPNDKACNLQGTGTISWLLRFDTTAGTLETGGAKPVASPSGPYTFDDQMVMQGANTLHVQPVTLTAPLSASCSFDSTPGDVLIPVFLDAMGTNVVVLPFHSVRLHAATMTADHGCIGRYNAETLSAANSCQPDATHPQFTSGGVIDGYMLLEETDRVVIGVVQQTLCVLLSGNATIYGAPGPGGVTVCKRDASNTIVFHGDWCAATNQAATATCFDSVQLNATFAAQAVQIQ
jgi:hypothetical protein